MKRQPLGCLTQKFKQMRGYCCCATGEPLTSIHIFSIHINATCTHTVHWLMFQTPLTGEFKNMSWLVVYYSDFKITCIFHGHRGDFPAILLTMVSFCPLRFWLFSQQTICLMYSGPCVLCENGHMMVYLLS